MKIYALFRGRQSQHNEGGQWVKDCAFHGIIHYTYSTSSLGLIKLRDYNRNPSNEPNLVKEI